ncbi:hypothetical protein KP005_19360 [Geomonas nitrogeniifigens]|uniref:Uncharacterized protein n=1 Tax=Geomonas diazotrophica TaxID=2843197 RepID=A0ABX8JK19_9BACT|nr:hypothetical protein [Geomonas nitrogeniifigens]QWV97466.1 hypothetical protein KP005_19360 [Geomonas nitrogeniifigens]
MTAIVKRNRQRGKENEKALAKMMKGDRKGLFGGEDISAGPWSIEAKSRVKSTVHTFMEQAKRNCPKGKMPMVIVHLHSSRRENDLVCVRLSDWRAVYGEDGQAAKEVQS